MCNFVQVFESAVTSGLLATLSGNAFKVLHVLALAASPLGTGPARDEAFFTDLVAAGALSQADRGRLFCCVPHEELARRAGIGKNTLSRCTGELEMKGAIEKRRVWGAGGRGYNVFFLLPASHVDKYNANRLGGSGEGGSGQSFPKMLGTGAASGEGGSRTAPTESAAGGCGLGGTPTPELAPGPENGTIRKGGTVSGGGTNYRYNDTTTPRPQPPRQFDAGIVFGHFCRRKGVVDYEPTAHDRAKLALLRARGYSEAEIVAAIDRAFDTRPADAPPIRMFSYCAAVALAEPPAASVPARDTASLPDAVAAPCRDTASRPGASLHAPPPVPARDTASLPDTVAAPCRDTASRPGASLHAPPPVPARDAASLPDAVAAPCRDTASRPDASLHAPPLVPARDTASLPDAPPGLAHALRLYEAEIADVSPMIRGELEALVRTFPDPAAWDIAFREAVRANVRKLSYVHAVLRARAAPVRRPRGAHDRGSRASGPVRTRRGEDVEGWADLAAAQRRAAAHKPVDLVAMLGTDDA